METLTVPQYAKIVGKSRQAITKSIRLGKMKNLKGVMEVFTIQRKQRVLYFLNYQSDENTLHDPE